MEYQKIESYQNMESFQMVERLLEFDKIKERWKLLALTETARRTIAAMVPYLSENELHARLRETSEARLLIEKAGTPPLVSLEGIAELLHAAKTGMCLSAPQLEQVASSLTAVKRMKEYLNQGKVYKISLPYYEENLETLEEIRAAVHGQIWSGRVTDNASKLLRSLRSEIEQTESHMKEKADNALRTYKAYVSDHFCTMRNGRICIPVKKEHRTKVNGTVLDKSATGNTLFVEPVSVAEYYEQLQSLRMDEENEERRILYTLTDMVADAAESMEQDIRMMEKLDFIFSKGKLSLEMQGIEAAINTERRICIRQGRHPLMDPNLCVPLNFQIGGDIRGVVITGPNTGGKTVAMKTVALNCLLAQCGLHVCCEEADICMNSNVLCDIGDGQNIAENLSTFSAHITNVLDILRHVNPDSLVLMDELGSGTDPTEGMGIAVAILEELRKSGALFLATTHYPEVKAYAEAQEGLINARMTFDKESLRPRYQLVIGEAGESCAFYIAQKLGMPNAMLEFAVRTAYGDETPEGLYLESTENVLKRESRPRIQKRKAGNGAMNPAMQFQLGDSVMVYPDKKIGIVCRRANEKGVLQVQMPNKKIWINYKRVKRLVSAAELYPEDYDFSIVFDTVENRKLRHQMERKHVQGAQIVLEKEKNT